MLLTTTQGESDARFATASQVASSIVDAGNGTHTVAIIKGTSVGISMGTHSIADSLGAIAGVSALAARVTTEANEEEISEGILIPANYIKDYLTATATLKRVEEYAELILSQPLINLSEKDADPATRLKMVEYQRHLKARALDYQRHVFSDNGYIEFFIAVHNFSISVQIALDIALQTLNDASADNGQLAALFDTVSFQAKTLILKANLVTQQFGFIKEDTATFAGSFTEILTKFDAAELNAITEIQREIKEALSKIDKTMADAITHSQAAGTALNGFFQSVIATIKPERIVSSVTKAKLGEVKKEKNAAAIKAKDEYGALLVKITDAKENFKTVEKDYAVSQTALKTQSAQINSLQLIIEKAEKEGDSTALEKAKIDKAKVEEAKTAAQKKVAKLKPIFRR